MTDGDVEVEELLKQLADTQAEQAALINEQQEVIEHLLDQVATLSEVVNKMIEGEGGDKIPKDLLEKVIDESFEKGVEKGGEYGTEYGYRLGYERGKKDAEEKEARRSVGDVRTGFL